MVRRYYIGRDFSLEVMKLDSQVASAPGVVSAIAFHSRLALSPELDMALQVIFGSDATLQIQQRGRNIQVSSGTSGRYNCRYSILPSQSSPRWLLPMNSHACAVRAAEVIVPHSRRAKVAKAALRVLIASGGLSSLSPQLTISADAEPRWLEMISELAATKDASIAFAFGTPGLFRKLTLLVMHPNSEPLAYIKLPMTSQAGDRIAREGEVLNQLGTSFLRPYVPQVLHSGAWRGMNALSITAGPAVLAPVRFGELHLKLLQQIWKVRPTQRTGDEIIALVRAALQRVLMTFPEQIAALCCNALECAKALLHSVVVPCGLMHGDFAPWNLRRQGEGLYAFDWESAQWDVPIVWDIAHYTTQLSSLLGLKLSFESITPHIEGAKGCHILYLVKSLADAATETGIDSPQVAVRVKLLSSMVSET